MLRQRSILTVLGCGTSTGVPVPACDCVVCTSGRERNQRLRTSALLRLRNGKQIVIDAGPDFRQQSLRTQLKRLDALLITHGHADHIFGMDDLRCFSFGHENGIPCYATLDTWKHIRRAFAYLFDRANDYEGGELAKLDVREISAFERFEACGVPVQAFPLMHGRSPVTGYRIGNLAYATDCNALGEGARQLLAGIEVLVLDGLRETPHRTHLTIDEAVQLSRTLGAKQTYLTHMTHSVDYDEVSQKLPQGVALAYDGLEIEFEF